MRLLNAAGTDIANAFRSTHVVQRVLSISGAILLLSAVVHLAVGLLSDRPWSGPLAWRKPILFAAATGITCLSLGWVWSHFRQTRFSLFLGTAAGMAAVAEVGLITLQTWRGVPSHFNTATGFDTAVNYAIDALVSILALAILWATIRSFSPLNRHGTPVDPDLALATRLGMVMLLASVAFGYWMLWHGTAQLEVGMPPERYGQAGVVKFVHGMPMHAIQILPIAAWLLRQLRVSMPTRYLVVASWGLGLIMATLFAALQTFRGRDRLDLDLHAGILLAIIALLHMLPLIPAFREMWRSSATPASAE